MHKLTSFLTKDDNYTIIPFTSSTDDNPSYFLRWFRNFSWLTSWDICAAPELKNEDYRRDLRFPPSSFCFSLPLSLLFRLSRSASSFLSSFPLSHIFVFLRRDDYDICITTYEMIVADVHGFVSRYMWSYVVMDEAHRVKNENSLLGLVSLWSVCTNVDHNDNL